MMIDTQMINTDCVAWMGQQPDQSQDIILTSPPYNLDLDYGHYRDLIPDYRHWLAQWIDQGCRLLRNTGRFIINIQPKYSDRAPYHHWIHHIMEKNRMIWYGERIWQKNNITGYRGAAGSMGRSSKPYLWYSTEYVQVFCKENLYRPCSAEQSLLTMPEQTAWAKDHIWNIAPVRQQRHPAQMPEQLVERCLKLFARRGDQVLDPFAGVGTTMRVCERLGLDSTGCEIDPDYVKSWQEARHDTKRED